MGKLLLSLMLFFVAIVSCHAQSMWGFNVNIYQTQGDFNKNVAAVPVGLGANYLYHIKESKIAFGADIGVAMYANNQYDFELPNGEIVAVDEEDCFWTLHGDVRYYFYEIPALKAYAQGRVGMTTFFSTRVPMDQESRYEGTSEIHGTAFNVGVGGGLLINFKALFNEEKKQGTANLDVGAGFYSGTSTNYRYMEDGSQSIALEDGKYNSLTHYVNYHIGIVFNPKWVN